MSTPEDINEVLELMNQCQVLAGEIGDTCFIEQTELKGLAGNFIARAAQSMFSAGLLAQQGLVADALSCGRTVVEMAIDFAYIALDPATHIPRFARYGDVHHFKLATSVNKHGGNIRAEHLSALEARSRAFRDTNSGTLANWAGQDLRRRATDSNRLELYELSYAEQCNASHSGPGTLEYAQVDVDGERQIRFGRMEPDTHPILLAYTAMLVLLGDVVTACGLDPKLGDRSTSLSNRVFTLREFNR